MPYLHNSPKRDTKKPRHYSKTEFIKQWQGPLMFAGSRNRLQSVIFQDRRLRSGPFHLNPVIQTYHFTNSTFGLIFKDTHPQSCQLLWLPVFTASIVFVPRIKEYPAENFTSFMIDQLI